MSNPNPIIQLDTDSGDKKPAIISRWGWTAPKEGPDWGYSCVPGWILRHFMKVEPNAKVKLGPDDLAFTVVAMSFKYDDYEGDEPHKATPSLERIGEILGRSLKQTRRYMQKLVKAGLLIVHAQDDIAGDGTRQSWIYDFSPLIAKCVALENDYRQRTEKPLLFAVGTELGGSNLTGSDSGAEIKNHGVDSESGNTPISEPNGPDAPSKSTKKRTTTQSSNTSTKAKAKTALKDKETTPVVLDPLQKVIGSKLLNCRDEDEMRKRLYKIRQKCREVLNREGYPGKPKDIELEWCAEQYPDFIRYYRRNTSDSAKLPTGSAHDDWYAKFVIDRTPKEGQKHYNFATGEHENWHDGEWITNASYIKLMKAEALRERAKAGDPQAIDELGYDIQAKIIGMSADEALAYRETLGPVQRIALERVTQRPPVQAAQPEPMAAR